MDEPATDVRFPRGVVRQAADLLLLCRLIPGRALYPLLACLSFADRKKQTNWSKLIKGARARNLLPELLSTTRAWVGNSRETLGPKNFESFVCAPRAVAVEADRAERFLLSAAAEVNGELSERGLFSAANRP